MQRSTVLFLLLGCTVVAVLAMIAFANPGDDPLPPGPVGTGPLVEDPPPEVPLVTGGPGGGNSLATVPPDAPHVTVTVTSQEKFIAPPPVVQLAVAVDGTPLPAEILAGVGAGFDGSMRRRGVALIAVRLAAGSLLRQVAVDPDVSAATRIGARIVVRGRVLDAVQQPVVAASVWFGELDGDGLRREAIVDEEGAFELDVPSGQGIPLVVRAPGYASTWRAITVAPDVQPLVSVLQPAATLQIQLAARAEQMSAARAFLVPSGQLSTGVAHWPFFLQCLAGGYAIDATGRVQIDDLPQHGQVGVVIRHPLASLGKAIDVRLAGPRARAVVPVRFHANRQQGLVVDENGDGLAAVSLWAGAASGRLGGVRSLRLLPPHLDMRGSCYASTASDGSYLLGVPDVQPGVLSVRARGRAGRDLSLAQAGQAPILLPEWRGGEAAVHISPPVLGKAWRVAINLGGGIEANCRADEPFVVSLPHAGRFDFDITVVVAGEVRGHREDRDVMVTGPFELSPPAPK